MMKERSTPHHPHPNLSRHSSQNHFQEHAGLILRVAYLNVAETAQSALMIPVVQERATVLLLSPLNAVDGQIN
jgi:hypothetical protein